MPNPDSEQKYQEHAAATKKQNQRVNLIGQVSGVNFRDLTDDQLTRIHNIINEPK